MASTEYDKIYHDAVKSTEAENVYDLIMRREANVLNTVNKVVNQKEEDKEKKQFLESPINKIVYRTFLVITNMATELNNGVQLNKVFKKERRLYLGLFMIALSIFFIILYSNH
jgi:hydrogenase-4 membrane subunit HyfE